MRSSLRSAAICIVAICACSASAAAARTLAVGADRALKTPSAAASVAADGDTIVIDAGEYFDCAVWRANNLTIEGGGENVVITDKACEGKGLFVIHGNDVTVRNLT